MLFRSTFDGVIDIAAAKSSGIAIPSTLVKNIVSIQMENIQSVTFVENKTNYDEYILKERGTNEMVVYHGGFLSPQKKIFMQKLADNVSENITIRFWADIDLGGFLMFYKLQQIFPKLQTLRMSSEYVIKYANRGLSRSKEYFTKLKTVGMLPEFIDFRETIDEILKNRVTIEQEVFLT